MGVHYLNTYSKLVGAFQRVNILQEIQQYRLEKQSVPVIVIDGISFLYAIGHSKNIPWLTGGNLLEFEKHCKLFIHNLRKNSVEVVVIFDGTNWIYNTDTWIRRRKERISEQYKNIFDKLDKNATVEEIECHCKRGLVSGAFAIANKVLIEEGCQVVKAVCDCDYEIAAYANEHQCMGIIADDTDFLINCSCNIYTTINLNIETMCLLKRDREKLLRSLVIDRKMLPLFASLVGNDVICSDEESHIKNRFKNSSGRIDVQSFFDQVANYIMSLKRDNGMSDADLEKVAVVIFNDSNKAELIKKSIESYSVSSVIFEDTLEERFNALGSSEWYSIIKMIYNYHRYGGGSSSIFSIVAQNTYQNVELIEDLRKNDLPAINKILRPLRKKIYGILLHEKPGKHFVEEMVVDNHDTIEPCMVETVSPEVFHPGLLALWGRVNEDWNWALLGDVVGAEPTKIQQLPHQLIVPALSLRYLKECAILEKWELRCFVLSSVIVSYMSEPYVSTISLRRVQSRAVRLKTLFNRANVTIHLLIESLGNLIPLDKTVPTHYEDGNVFHLIYNTMKAGIKSSKILKLGFQIFFRSKFAACEATIDQMLNFVLED